MSFSTQTDVIVDTSDNALQVLTTCSTTIGSFLEPPTLLALARVNKPCREAFWKDKLLWKAVVQTQLYLPGQPVPETNEDWRDCALVMQNILTGRYRVAVLDPNVQIDGNESDDSDYEDDDSDDEEEEEVQSLDEEEIVSPSPEEREEENERIQVDGQLV